MLLNIKLFMPLSLLLTYFLSVCALASDEVAVQAVFADGWQSHRLQGNKLILSAPQGKVSLEYISQDSIYVHYLAKGVKQLPGYLLDEKRLDEKGASTKAGQVLKLFLKATDKTLIFSSKTSSVVVHKSPFRLSFFHRDQLKLQEELGYLTKGDSQEFRFKLMGKEKLFAGGERVLGMDRRGFNLPLYNKADYAYEGHSKQMNFSLPGLMSSEKYILMFDNTARGSLDLGAAEKDVLHFAANGGRSAYLVAMADSFPELVSHYTNASGRQPMPPIWALGNIASRFGYRSETQARAVVAEYQDQQMPIDAIIFDLYWFGPDIKGHMGNLDWDRKAFPTAEKMVKDFEDMGIKTILISEPFVLTKTKNWRFGAAAGAFSVDEQGKAKTFDFYFGNTSLVDVFSKQGQSWFWPFYQQQLDWGIAGFWGDLGEPEVHPQNSYHYIERSGQKVGADEVHNAYGHQWAKMVFDGFSRVRSKQRPFIMMRSGFAGSQRYGMIPWTGDVSRTWQALQAQVELSLQMGILGLGYTHSDLGGFVASEAFDAELYVRWLQYGAFQPVFRPHAQDQMLPEPVFHGEDVAERIKAALSWRYQLLPYNYTLVYENHSKGLPLMRPRFFAEQSDKGNVVAEKDFSDSQGYFWGSEMLVLPVTAPGITVIDYALPQGNWFDYFTDKPYVANGREQQQFPVSLDNIPVLVKGGAIIPHAPDMQNTREYSGDELIVHYWFDTRVAQSHFQLYQDDGLTRAYQQGAFTKIDFSAQTSDGQLTFNIALADSVATKKLNKKLILVVHNAPYFQQVAVAGKPLESEYQLEKKQLKLTIAFDGKPLGLTFH